MKSSSFRAILGLVVVGIVVTPCVSVAQRRPDWQINVDWSARNTDAGGSVNCQGDYVSAGVAYAIVSGGRAAVINAALFAAQNQDFNRAFNLVLLTQCHNDNAWQSIFDAGQKTVLSYLLRSYKPNGVDPDRAASMVQQALMALASGSGN